METIFNEFQTKQNAINEQQKALNNAFALYLTDDEGMWSDMFLSWCDGLGMSVINDELHYQCIDKTGEYTPYTIIDGKHVIDKVLSLLIEVTDKDGNVTDVKTPTFQTLRSCGNKQKEVNTLKCANVSDVIATIDELKTERKRLLLLNRKTGGKYGAELAKVCDLIARFEGE